jgi:STE24 endopeptidase
MSKAMRTIWILYLIYAILMIGYIVSINPSHVPLADQGGPSDPNTFLTAKQIADTNHLSRIEYIAFFLVQPLRWIFYVSILSTGYNRLLKRLTSRFRLGLVRNILFCILLLFTLLLINLPIDLFFYLLDRKYNLSSQSPGSWLVDLSKSFGVELVTQIPVYLFVFYMLRKSPKRWWLYTWMIAIPISVFMMFLQPVVLDPIFNDFKPLTDQQLRSEIMTLASKAGIPTDKIYVVDKSKQTNELNAYVTGVGNTTRIVYWDTLLKQMSKGEIVFVTAHEMGHYVKKHIYWGLAIGLILAFFVLWLYARIYRYLIQRYGRRIGVDGLSDIAALPLALLLYSILSFAISPIENGISRVMEHQADMYAYQLTHDKIDGIKTFQTFARTSLAGVNPPGLVYYFLEDHPTLLQRIDYIKSR